MIQILAIGSLIGEITHIGQVHKDCQKNLRYFVEYCYRVPIARVPVSEHTCQFWKELK